MSLRLVSLNGESPSNLITQTTYQAEIALNSKDKQLVGADAYINYDPTMVEILSIRPGTAFPTYPTADFSEKNGIITVSGIMPMRETFNGEDIMGIVEFKPISSGNTTLELDFAPGNTRDCNMVEAGTAKDVLGSVKNLSLTIN